MIQINGHHYHNQDTGNESAEYIRRTLLRNLMDMPITLPDAQGNTTRGRPAGVGHHLSGFDLCLEGL